MWQERGISRLAAALAAAGRDAVPQPWLRHSKR